MSVNVRAPVRRRCALSLENAISMGLRSGLAVQPCLEGQRQRWHALFTVAVHLGASQRFVPACQLCRHQPADGAILDHPLLQSARHRRAVHQGRQTSDHLDTLFLQGHGAERRPPSASRIVMLGPSSFSWPRWRSPAPWSEPSSPPFVDCERRRHAPSSSPLGVSPARPTLLSLPGFLSMRRL